MMRMNISIKRLTVEDWLAFSEIRLRALQTDPQVFGSNYAAESQFTEEDWKKRLVDTENSAIFALFDEEEPIGMTGVSVWRDDETKSTAILWGSWLAPDYRGKGLSDVIYRARIDWAKKHPTIRRLIVSHRASNLASKYANRKHNFKFTGTDEKVWNDGAVEDEVCYELFIEKEQ